MRFKIEVVPGRSEELGKVLPPGHEKGVTITVTLFQPRLTPKGTSWVQVVMHLPLSPFDVEDDEVFAGALDRRVRAIKKIATEYPGVSHTDLASAITAFLSVAAIYKAHAGS